MPRTSSFSVRDILDLPQMKSSSEGSVTTGGVETDGISHATDLYAAASAQRLQGNFWKRRVFNSYVLFITQMLSLKPSKYDDPFLN